MNQYQLYAALDNAFQGMWTSSVAIVPNIIIALSLIFIGYLLAGMVKGG